MAPLPHPERVIRSVSVIGGLLTFLLIPPLFERLLSPSFLVASDRVFLWSLAAAIGSISLILLKCRAEWSQNMAASWFGILLLVSIELMSRFVVCAFLPEQRLALARIGGRAYSELAVYAAHPFVQFTGNPSSKVVEDHILGNLSSFNNFGFHGRDFVYEKPAGVVRIATLGGSTTATGYPEQLGNYLNEQWSDLPQRAEILNFGLGWYNSAHSLANFVFTVRDFSPDYVVIHHATNEKNVRNFSTGYRGDYSHVLKAFDVPVVKDWIPLRLSVIYRYLRYHVASWPPPEGLTLATQLRAGDVRENQFSNLGELRPFRRNIKTVIDLALIDGISPVLTTQPHRSVPTRGWEDWIPHMIQANDILREIAAEYGERILFVDLDRMMTGTMDDLFVDLVHVNPDGRRFKAWAVGKAILDHFRVATAAR